jgi:hypothetical protein
MPFLWQLGELMLPYEVLVETRLDRTGEGWWPVEDGVLVRGCACAMFLKEYEIHYFAELGSPTQQKF